MFCFSNASNVCVEEGIPNDVIEKLKVKGHKVSGPLGGWDRSLFGRGHVITRGAWWKHESRSDLRDDPQTWWAGSDARADGVALGY